MAEYPDKLRQLLEDFRWMSDRAERAEYLIELADRLQPVPEHIATRPYPPENHVDYCESDAYVWAEDREDGTLQFYFAVENPQGLSARAIAAILDETLSGQPLEQVARVPDDIVLDIFGRNIAMGKGQGLMGIVARVRAAAQQRLAARQVPWDRE